VTWKYTGAVFHQFTPLFWITVNIVAWLQFCPGFAYFILSDLFSFAFTLDTMLTSDQRSFRLDGKASDRYNAISSIEVS
jgi:hypothetical protein